VHRFPPEQSPCPLHTCKAPLRHRLAHAAGFPLPKTTQHTPPPWFVQSDVPAQVAALLLLLLVLLVVLLVVLVRLVFVLVLLVLVPLEPLLVLLEPLLLPDAAQQVKTFAPLTIMKHITSVPVQLDALTVDATVVVPFVDDPFE
jgi:hypothetical protein